MKTLLYENRAEPKSISVISILLLAAAGDITKLRCMHRECYIFASQNIWLQYNIHCIIHCIVRYIQYILYIVRCIVHCIVYGIINITNIIHYLCNE